VMALVVSGSPTMFSSGETSAPSQVYSAGIASPSSKAGEETERSGSSVVVVVGGTVVVVDAGALVVVVSVDSAAGEQEAKTTMTDAIVSRRLIDIKIGRLSRNQQVVRQSV